MGQLVVVCSGVVWSAVMYERIVVSWETRRDQKIQENKKIPKEEERP